MLTYKFRIKDKTCGKRLAAHSQSVNFVWNFCVQTQREAQRKRHMGAKVFWPGAFDLINLCSGASKELILHSDTIAAVCRQFVKSRDLHHKCPRFRVSFGAKRSLGWLPFVSRAVKIEGGSAVYLKRRYCFWKSRDLPEAFKSGCFVEDARGRWYVTFQCEVADELPAGPGEIGIDLGLKTLAVCSNGDEIPALRHYRRYERALATAQRANNKRRVKAIHAKIANSRKHHLHEQSTKIVRENKLIVVGNVNPSKLVKTRMAKSVLDAGWTMFRNQLEYKAARRPQAVCIIADERWTSQTCSSCGARSGPKGIAGLGIRSWTCSCGAVHDRDLNAAKNILRFGLERQAPAEEISILKDGEDVIRAMPGTGSR